MRNNRGISLIALAATVTIIIILTSTIVVTSTGSINRTKKMAFANELLQIQSAVDVYRYERQNDTSLNKNPITNTNAYTGVPDAEGQSLYEIDMSLINIQKLSKGVKKSGDSSDIYVVSSDGKVYYLKGAKIGNVIYYGLNPELTQYIEYNNVSSNAATTTSIYNMSDGISIEVNNAAWTSTNITATVRYPIDNKLVNNEALIYTMPSGGTTYTGPRSAASGVCTINDITGNYRIKITYSILESDGVTVTPKVIMYDITNCDSTAPTLSSSTQHYIENATSGKVEGFIRIAGEDLQSGVKIIKYDEGTFSNSEDTYKYFVSNGKTLSNESFKIGTNNKYTVYIEDKAGNKNVYNITVDPTIFAKIQESNSPGPVYNGTAVTLKNAREMTYVGVVTAQTNAPPFALVAGDTYLGRDATSASDMKYYVKNGSIIYKYNAAKTALWAYPTSNYTDAKVDPNGNLYVVEAYVGASEVRTGVVKKVTGSNTYTSCNLNFGYDSSASYNVAVCSGELIDLKSGYIVIRNVTRSDSSYNYYTVDLQRIDTNTMTSTWTTELGAVVKYWTGYNTVVDNDGNIYHLYVTNNSSGDKAYIMKVNTSGAIVWTSGVIGGYNASIKKFTAFVSATGVKRVAIEYVYTYWSTAESWVADVDLATGAFRTIAEMPTNLVTALVIDEEGDYLLSQVAGDMWLYDMTTGSKGAFAIANPKFNYDNVRYLDKALYFREVGTGLERKYVLIK